MIASTEADRRQSVAGVGTLLNGRCRLDAETGRGGTVVVYGVHDTNMTTPLLATTISPCPE
jgi:hypothetical protein